MVCELGTDSIIGSIKTYNAVVISATDYYPFGMAIDSRVYSGNSSVYRMGFNGKENDKETNDQDYGMRIYDARVPHFFSIDPIIRSFPDLSPYQFAGNNPIKFIDMDGLEPWFDESLNKPRPPVLFVENNKTVIKGYAKQWVMGYKYDYTSNAQIPILKKGGEYQEDIPKNKKGSYAGAFSSNEIALVEEVFKLNRHAREALRGRDDQYGTLDERRYCAYDCITSVLAGLQFVQPNIRSYNVDGDMDKFLNKLAANGLAGKEISCVAQPNGNFDAGKSVTEQLRNAVIGKKGVHIFGVSINKGNHSAIIIVDNMNDNGSEAGSNISFRLYDQAKWNGNQVSGVEVDNILGNYSAGTSGSNRFQNTRTYGIKMREILKNEKK